MSQATLVMSWDREAPFIMEKQVTADVIDGLQHVNNAAYVGWCEEAGWAHSEDLGLGLEAWKVLDRAMAIRHSEFDYCLAAYEGDRLLVGTWLTGNDGKLAMERRFQVVREKDGETVLRARWQLVCIEMSTGRPRRMPKEFLSIYGAVTVTP